MIIEKYKLLRNKEIAKVLDGDTTFGNFDGYDLELGLPILTGPDICRVAQMFGSTIEYTGKKARWEYVFDLIDCGIETEKIASTLAYLFDESNFSKNINTELNKAGFAQYYKQSVESARGKINSLLHYSGDKIIIDNQKVLILPIKPSMPELSVKNVKTVDSDYIKVLIKRASDNVKSGDNDSALTQARTILEETFDYVLEKRNIHPSSKGDINKLYKQVKSEYKMHADKNADKRINRLLSGLENIVSAVSEMRNKNSDSHGVGEKRLAIDKHHARLAVNAAITMADFILSVEKKANSSDDY